MINLAEEEILTHSLWDILTEYVCQALLVRLQGIRPSWMRRGYPTVVDLLYMTVACQYLHCNWRKQHLTHPTVTTDIPFTKVAVAYGPVGPNPLPAAFVLLLKRANFWIADGLYRTVRISCGGHRRIIFVFLHVEVGSREIKMVDNRNLCLCAREGF